ncbi:MAG: hypothetical protein E7112_07205 [Bacteroidales bacterium]|nr:hypothetical protein [Bacteroidales bacterium]
MQGDRDDEVDIAEMSTSGQPFSKHLSEMSSSSDVAVILYLICYLPVGGILPEYEECGCICIPFLSLADALLHQIVEAVGHRVAGLLPEICQRHLRQTFQTEMPFPDVQPAFADQADAWQQEVCCSGD